MWHTSVVVDGVEYFYGGGVQQAMAGTTPYGEPVDIIYLGYKIIHLAVRSQPLRCLRNERLQAGHAAYLKHSLASTDSEEPCGVQGHTHSARGASGVYR